MATKKTMARPGTSHVARPGAPTTKPLQVTRGNTSTAARGIAVSLGKPNKPTFTAKPTPNKPTSTAKPTRSTSSSKGNSYTQTKKPTTKRESMAANRANRAAYESATKRERMTANRAVRAGTASSKQKQIAAHTQKLKANKSK